MSKCACHSGIDYEECCHLYHHGDPAPSPLALMRSRYSAYALKKIDYIMETTYPPVQKGTPMFDTWRQGIIEFSEKTVFKGLDILEEEKGKGWGFVTFRAKLSRDGKDVSFVERSRFEKKEGRWFYV